MDILIYDVSAEKTNGWLRYLQTQLLLDCKEADVDCTLLAFGTKQRFTRAAESPQLTSLFQRSPTDLTSFDYSVEVIKLASLYHSEFALQGGVRILTSRRLLFSDVRYM